MLFAPRYIFSFFRTKSARITFKEVLTHGVVFGFAVIVAQFISKRYGVFEGFSGEENIKIGPPILQRGTKVSTAPPSRPTCPTCPPKVTIDTPVGTLCKMAGR